MKERLEERRKERSEGNDSGSSGYHKPLLLLVLVPMPTSPGVVAEGGGKILPKVFRIARFEEVKFECSRSLR